MGAITETTMTSLDDKRPIYAIHSDLGQFSIRVGMEMVTKITIYGDAGSAGYIARAAIWKGDQIHQRMDLHGCRIEYYMGEPSGTEELPF